MVGTFKFKKFLSEAECKLTNFGKNVKGSNLNLLQIVMRERFEIVH